MIIEVKLIGTPTVALFSGGVEATKSGLEPIVIAVHRIPVLQLLSSFDSLIDPAPFKLLSAHARI